MFTKSTFLLFLAFLALASARSIKITNRCRYSLWPAWKQGNGAPKGGNRLDSGKSLTINVPDNWTAGRIWARTFCNGAGADCATRDAAVSLGEWTLKGAYGMDTYDVSLVDGFNVPITIRPSNGCKTIGTSSSAILDKCPGELKVSKGGRAVQCLSACTKFGMPEYCCTGAFSKPKKCPSTKYAHFFKSNCPTCYSYAYDDKTSTFTCKDANYEVYFC